MPLAINIQLYAEGTIPLLYKTKRVIEKCYVYSFYSIPTNKARYTR